MIKRFIGITSCVFMACTMAFGQSNTSEDQFFKDFVSRNWNAESGLPGNTITDIMQDNDGYMYFGTYSGLLRFDGVEFISMNRLYDARFDFLSARTTFQDTRGHIWIGSNDEGVTCIKDNGEILRYTVNDGLPNNSIRAICEDKNNFIWIGTASGITCVNRQYILENEHILEAVIGLPANLFYGTGIPAAIAIFRKGRNSEKVLFIDASREFENGKNQNKLRPEDIKHIVDTYCKFADGKLPLGVVEDKYAYVATPDEIRENAFNLNIPRYVDTYEEEAEINIPAVQKEIEQLETELADVQVKMKEYLKQLGY